MPTAPRSSSAASGRSPSGTAPRPARPTRSTSPPAPRPRRTGCSARSPSASRVHTANTALFDQEANVTDTRPPLPPFTEETARQKVLAAEAAWNTRDPARVAAAYTVDSVWRNRDEFVTGRDEIEAFLTRKWARELEYALRKDLWAFGGNRIAVRFQYECRDADGAWWRSYGNELWEFDEHGLMRRREASINDVRIEQSERRILGP